MSLFPPIEDSFQELTTYPTVTERYYNCYSYLPKSGPENEHHCILLHSNKICLISLSPNHPVIQLRKTIKKLDFQATQKIDRLQNQVRGKGKKGAQVLQPDSVICNMECDDNSRYIVRACVKGKLIEINRNLLINHQLLVEKPLSDGYIAIVLPGLKDVERQIARFTPMTLSSI